MFIVILCIAVVITCICWSIVLSKITNEGWKGFIPFYGSFIRFSLFEKEKAYVVHLVSIVFMIINVFFCYSMHYLFKYDPSKQHETRKLMLIFAAFAFICYIVYAITNYLANKEIIKALGFEEEDATYLSFLPIVFLTKFTVEHILKNNTTRNIQTKKNSRMRQW